MKYGVRCLDRSADFSVLNLEVFIDERSEIATEPAVRRLRGHDRAREETKGLIPRCGSHIEPQV